MVAESFFTQKRRIRTYCAESVVQLVMAGSIRRG